MISYVSTDNQPRISKSINVDSSSSQIYCLKFLLSYFFSIVADNNPPFQSDFVWQRDK